MSVGLSLVGGVVSALGSIGQAKASKKAEALRQQQMNLEAVRKQREMVREGIVARASATSNAVSQGAGEGSGLS